MSQPLGDDGHRDTPKVQRGAARVAGIGQPDRAHTGRLRQPVPHVRQRARRVRLPGLVARDVTAVGVGCAHRQLLLRIASRCLLEHGDQTLIKRQRGVRSSRCRRRAARGESPRVCRSATPGGGVEPSSSNRRRCVPDPFGCNRRRAPAARRRLQRCGHRLCGPVKSDAAVPAASTPGPAAQPSTRVPAVAGPVLDGTYRVDLDFEHQTLNGAPAPSSDTTAWWTFRSTCTPTGCAATATKLDANLNQAPKIPGSTDVFHFVDGRWQNAPTPYPGDQACPGVGTVPVTMVGHSSWTPQPDGTFQGVQTATAQTDVCGSGGEVYLVPFVATRIGDVPAGVTVADPASADEPAPPPAAPPPSPASVPTCNDGAIKPDGGGADGYYTCVGGHWVLTVPTLDPNSADGYFPK